MPDIAAVPAAVTVNGQPYSKATRKRIGFVLQDDVLYESLTVKVSQVLSDRLSRHCCCTDLASHSAPRTQQQQQQQQRFAC